MIQAPVRNEWIYLYEWIKLNNLIYLTGVRVNILHCPLITCTFGKSIWYIVIISYLQFHDFQSDKISIRWKFGWMELQWRNYNSMSLSIWIIIWSIPEDWWDEEVKRKNWFEWDFWVKTWNQQKKSIVFNLFDLIESHQNARIKHWNGRGRSGRTPASVIHICSQIEFFGDSNSIQFPSIISSSCDSVIIVIVQN